MKYRLNDGMRVIASVALVLSLAGCGGNNDHAPAGLPMDTREEQAAQDTVSKDNANKDKAVIENAPQVSDTMKDILEPMEDLPDQAPEDIPILQDAQNVQATKVGEAAFRGDLFYEISFQVETTVEQTAELYRNELNTLGYDYADSHQDDGTFESVGSTGEWGFRLSIVKSTEHEDLSDVKIVYMRIQ